MTAAAQLEVVAVKATIGDGPDRVVVGWLRADGRFWCEQHGVRTCAHVAALAELLLERARPGCSTCGSTRHLTSRCDP